MSNILHYLINLREPTELKIGGHVSNVKCTEEIVYSLCHPLHFRADRGDPVRHPLHARHELPGARRHVAQQRLVSAPLHAPTHLNFPSRNRAKVKT